jgi:hypothetical protein
MMDRPNGGRKFDVKVECEGLRFGPLFVHNCDFDRENWRVTHLDTSRLVTAVGHREDAVRIAVLLVEKFSGILRMSHVATIRQCIPAWVKEWCKRCQEKGRYVDPPKETT